jgi:hypothetical protein
MMKMDFSSLKIPNILDSFLNGLQGECLEQVAQFVDQCFMAERKMFSLIFSRKIIFHTHRYETRMSGTLVRDTSLPKTP